MHKRHRALLLDSTLIIVTLAMIIFRFLLNEKGRVNPDSIRFMRTAHVLPTVDNTTTPLGYPMALKLLTFFGLDEFWSSKLIGILAYFFIIVFAWKKNFYRRETILVGGLFSYVSIYSYTMSEPLMMPFVFIFLYLSAHIITGKMRGFSAFAGLSIILIALYNIRYPALFMMAATGLFGLINYRKSFGRTFMAAGLAGLFFVISYKFLFIDYFNENYIDQALEVGLHPTSKLLHELAEGLPTVFNPFIHILNPGGGMVNYAIIAIGLANMLVMGLLFGRNRLSLSEQFMLTVTAVGIACSFFIQYFYSVNPIDYRLLAPFVFPVWLLYFNKILKKFRSAAYGITALSFLSGFAFMWLSRGNYLENRRQIKSFLQEENMTESRIYFYMENTEEMDKMRIAELISTVNPDVKVTFKAADSLRTNTLTKHKVLQKVKIDRNQHQ